MTNMTRRTFIGATLAATGCSSSPAIEIDPTPRFELSPFLYMQFMEPLGTTDGSVEAAWNHDRNDWRDDVISVSRELAPAMLRWGGIFSDYYRWREGVGPRDQRPVMRNLLWGGIESNQVGTAEFVDFARRVGAEPLMCVNFSSDGRERYMYDGKTIRTAGAREAAEWVAYANRPGHSERIAHGYPEPHSIRYWQLGNETSYDPGGFRLEQAQRKTVEFARAMRAADPAIKLIGWGGLDRGSERRNEPAENWTAGMAQAAGEHLDYLAFHHMYNPDDPDEPALAWGRFREDPARTWQVLMRAWEPHDAKIRRIRELLGSHQMPLAMTECHFAMPGRNRCEVLSTWACGVSYARLLNVHERHGDVLKIATAADFCGTRWQVNAVMIPVPGGESFLMPVAHVMKLYRQHTGTQAVEVTAPVDLDVTASRSGDTYYLHVVNTNRTLPRETELRIGGTAVDGTVHEIAVDPTFEIRKPEPQSMTPVETKTDRGRYRFAAASVSAVELKMPATS